MSTTAGISPTRGFAIRAATVADADAIFGMLEQLGAGFTPDRVAFDASFLSAVEGSVTDPDRGLFLLVASSTSDETAVGYALVTTARLFSTNGTAAQVQELVVDHRWRGQRVGTALVTAVESECRARGAVHLTVASLRGAAFYEGLGYRSSADYVKKSLIS